MKKNNRRMAVWMALFCLGMTACNHAETPKTETAVSAETTVQKESERASEETVLDETQETLWETLAADEVDADSYEISGGTWFYTGIEDEKSIDMDGLKGFTAYTPEAIPETEGYLQYLGINPNGCHVFDVYDIYGVFFTTMTFVSEEQFYLGEDENEFYIKWNY